MNNTPNIKELIIVTGLPRSGTSLMMQILQKIGLSILYDNSKSPDEHNPLGYFEYVKVKDILKSNDWEWLKEYTGFAIKIISPILIKIPIDFPCKIILMLRDLDEIVASQEKLSKIQKSTYEKISLKTIYSKHLSLLRKKLQINPEIQMLELSYNELVIYPPTQLIKLSKFLEVEIDIENISKIIDTKLYRMRH